MSKKSIALVTFFLVFLTVFFFLKKAFSGEIILQQNFSLGFITIRYYGVTMALAVFTGWVFAISRAKKLGIGRAELENLLTWLVVGGFLGARLYHVFSSISFYAQNPLEIFQVWHGGLSIFGALIGGFLVLLWKSGVILNLRVRHSSTKAGFQNLKIKLFRQELNTTVYKSDKIKYLYSILDCLTPSVVLGQIIGRFGNLFNYEAFGYPTNLPWKMFVPENFRLDGLVAYKYFHPLFLYEAIGNFIILFFLLGLEKNRQSTSKTGIVFASYIFLYNLLRFFIEALRVDSAFIGGFRLNMVVSASLCLISGLWLSSYFLRLYKHDKKISSSH